MSSSVSNQFLNRRCNNMLRSLRIVAHLKPGNNCVRRWSSNGCIPDAKDLTGPHFRHNALSDEWVVFNPVRRSRPKQFQDEVVHKIPIITRDEKCPFCPGNEHLTPKALVQECSAENGDWNLRVIPNKFPVVSPMQEGNVQASPSPQTIHQTYSGTGASGHHEVIIETPIHHDPGAYLKHGPQIIERLLVNFRARARSHVSDHRTQQILMFKNNGQAAGASLLHPHAQLVALPIVPKPIADDDRYARHQYEKLGGCLFCHYLQAELDLGTRIVSENEDAVMMVPFAATTPFSLVIMPKRHSAWFFEVDGHNDDLHPEEVASLAKLISQGLTVLNELIDNLAFNLVVRSAPLPRGSFAAFNSAAYYHSHVEIIPRLGAGATAGFEIGSGMHSNSSLPEDDAEKLREFIKGI
eukprot:m.77469 g.77469  ORF g.77469 m.77469 type:complete len:410 (-) comp12626_c0_seq1:71-1300(-)